MAIDNPYAISAANVKTILQITGTTYDTLINFYLPIVTEDIDLITNQTWTVQYSGTLTDSSAVISSVKVGDPTYGGQVSLSAYGNLPTKGWLVSTAQVSNSAIADYDIDNSTITISDNATADLSDADVLINQFPKAKWPVAAQMVAFQIVKNNGIESVNKSGIASRTMGPLSVSYQDIDNALSNGFGYPGYILSTLKLITVPRFR